MVVQRVLPRRSDPKEFIHVSLQEFIEVSIYTVSWIGGRAKAGSLSSTFKVKTRQSGVPRMGVQTGVRAVRGLLDWSVSRPASAGQTYGHVLIDLS